MRNILDFREMSGGAAIELAASRGNPLAYEFGIPMVQYRDCNFSFAAFKNNIFRVVTSEEKKYGL